MDLMPVPEPLPLPQESVPIMAQYQWTGSMAELYKPSEITLDFEAMMAGDEWMVTDITNPVEMDNFLETAGGFTPDELYAGRRFIGTLQMKTADHLQSLASRPT